MSTGPIPATISEASVVLVTVQDSQLAAALAELEAAGLAPGTVVLHASGSAYPVQAIRRLRELGHPVGTFHPLVPIPRPDRAPALMRGAWVGVDGDPEAVRAATVLAAAAGARLLAIPSYGRAAYHAAAVMASNFPTVLAGLAASLMHSVGVDEASARAAVRHLMRAAVTNLAEAEPDVALTGPITRGDVDTVASHLGRARSVARARRRLPCALAGCDPDGSGTGHRSSGPIADRGPACRSIRAVNQRGLIDDLDAVRRLERKRGLFDRHVE